MLIFVSLAILFGVVLALSVTSRRKKEAKSRIEAFAAGVRARHVLESLFVSKLDSSFVGLNYSQGTLVVGEANWEGGYRFSDVSWVEIIKNGVAIDPATGEGGERRLQSLGVRITVDDPERPVHFYRIFDWPRADGPAESSPYAATMLDQAFRIRASLLEGIRLARSAPP